MVTLKKIKKKASEFKKHMDDVRFFKGTVEKPYYIDLPKRTKVRTYLNLIQRLNEGTDGTSVIVLKFRIKNWFLLAKWFSKFPNMYFSHPLKRIPNKILVSHKLRADIRINFDFNKVISESRYLDNVIPYTMHPSIYLREDDIPVHEEKYGGAIAAGNFSEKIYNTDIIKSSYGLNNRWEIYNRLLTLSDCVRVKGRKYMAEFEDKRYMSKLVLMDWHSGGIPGYAWLEHLSTFRYIFCSPGMTMPLCHNILEAMHVGVVPITNYANWLNPSLEDGVNCFTYGDLDDIEEVLRRALILPEEEYLTLRKNAIEYYRRYYSNYSIEKGVYTLLNEDKRDL